MAHDELSTPASASASDVSRRGFLGLGLAGGAMAIADLKLPGGRHLAARLAVPGAPAHVAFDLEEVTVAQLQQGMSSGQYTARSIAERYLARIGEVDKQGPLPVNAIIELNPDALAIADAMDAERKAGKLRGPMHGIPVLIKDNIGTADRMETTAGSLALVGGRPLKDSFIAARLRAAGAVILGKTNLSEWANFRSTHSASGWSGRGGQTRNPFALDRTPSGSSSGTGSAISANFAAVGIGSETDGSITSPSSCAALVGIKPTVGLISRAGVVPISHTQDTAGPMTRTVADAAALLSALVGVDADDAATVASRGRFASDYTKFLDPNGLKGARIGVARAQYTGYNANVDKLFERALDAMKQAGAVIVDPANIATHAKLDSGEFDVLLYEFKADLASYFASLGPNAPVKSLADVIAFNDRNATKELPYFGQEIMTMSQKKGPLTEAAYRKALSAGKRNAGALGIDATVKKYRLDAIVGPTQGPAGLIDLVNGGQSGGGGSFTSPAAVAGYPHITVPSGYIFGMPVGVSFVGPAWSEATLIKLAYAYEQATKVRRPPRMLATADLTQPAT